MVSVLLDKEIEEVMEEEGTNRIMPGVAVVEAEPAASEVMVMAQV